MVHTSLYCHARCLQSAEDAKIKYDYCAHNTPGDMPELARLWKLLSDDEQNAKISEFQAFQARM